MQSPDCKNQITQALTCQECLVRLEQEAFFESRLAHLQSFGANLCRQSPATPKANDVKSARKTESEGQVARVLFLQLYHLVQSVM